MALCADAVVKDGELVGDPTEGALVVLAAKGGVDPTLTRERYPRVAEVPFDAAYKLMATFHRMTGRRRQGRHPGYVKGAPGPAPRARRRSRRRARRRRGPRRRRSADRYLAENERLGAQGLRVMATGQQDFDPATFDAERRPAAAGRRT